MRVINPTRTHNQLTGVTSDQHHAAAHIAASHSDQGATGAELNTLVGGGETTLHSHATAGLTLIGTAVAAASADLTITGLDSTFDAYLIIISDIVPATDAVNLRMRVGDAGGIDSGVSDYGSSVTGNAAYMDVLTSIGSAVGEGVSAEIWLLRPGDGSTKPIFAGTTVGLNSANNLTGAAWNGQRKAVIVLDRIQILFSVGNIASGRLSVYGVAHV